MKEMRRRRRKEEEEEEVFDRIISVAGYPSPGASVHVQQEEGFSSADAYKERLLVLGSSNDDSSSTKVYNYWWDALTDNGACVVMSATFTHNDYDMFLEGVKMGNHDVEDDRVAAVPVLHSPPHPSPLR